MQKNIYTHTQVDSWELQLTEDELAMHKYEQ